jgi:hypothetical protein
LLRPGSGGGVLRSGDAVELLHEGQVVVITKAFVEFHPRPGRAALGLPNVIQAKVRRGDVVRAVAD